MSFESLSLPGILIVTHLLVQSVTAASRCEMEGKHRQDFKHDKAEANIQEVLAILLDLRSEEADVDELVHDNVESGQRHNSTLDDTNSIEFRVVNETQIVLVDVVFEEKEAHGEDGHVGDDRREDHSNSKHRQTVRHVVA